MPKRKVLIGVTIARGIVTTKNSRGGEISRPAERIDLKPGQVFDFTEDEIDEIESTNPGALSASAEASLDDGTVTSPEVVAKKTGGKKAAASKADENL